ncbi:nitroreductase family protein [Fulvivirgaceae bacterium BMA10]|uniref:Nitroreductase family protein n=1 Tax=Splendidivirga corallicola TaxID=3051826 RepID=A0ABT8KX38_9BACT|nr:nitroreductase family protein [Fulvivirgaceae bacterium BMA10]
MIEKEAITDFDVHELIKKRWSPRAFSTKPVDLIVIKELLEAARWSASSFNEQPWRFIVGIKDQNKAYEKILDALVEFNQLWAKNAPVLILACGSRKFEHNGKDNRHYAYDVGQAVASLAIQATDANLYLHQMAGFDPGKAQEALNIPNDYDPLTVIALGYKDSPDTLNDKLKEMELKERTRRPLSEICFGDTWNFPL